jgi:hypothetical protein
VDWLFDKCFESGSIYFVGFLEDEVVMLLKKMNFIFLLKTIHRPRMKCGVYYEIRGTLAFVKESKYKAAARRQPLMYDIN